MSLTSPQILSGIAVKYKGNGRKLGYPTANIDSDTNLPDGVYFGYADLGSYHHRPALIFVGTPTTMGDTERRVEAHVLDIDDIDYYGQELTLTLEVFHRPNETFKSMEELMVVMKNDEAAGRSWAQGLQREDA